MSKKVNVNPDHYKTAGRERQGENIVQEIHRQKFALAKATNASKKIALKPKTSKSVKRKAKR